MIAAYLKNVAKKEYKMLFIYIIHESVFCSGYINYLKYNFTNVKHVFILKNSFKYRHELVDTDNIYFVDEYTDVLDNDLIMNDIKKSDRIIFSGLFDSKRLANKLAKYSSKIEIQLWGGDFYQLLGKNSIRHFRTYLNNMITLKCIKKSSRILTLIDGDYDVVKRILKKEKNHITLPIPPDPLNSLNPTLYRNNKTDDFIRILVGNSASETNCHCETFDLLRRFRDDNIQIICPLSYGDMDYKNKVIERGKEIFGNKFIALENFMEIHEYAGVISKCNVAIMNVNRQQALGNIHGLLNFGVKVYIREDTSMWNTFLRYGYTVFPVQDIEITDFKDFAFISPTSVDKNYIAHDNYINGIYDSWKRFLYGTDFS